MSFYDHFKHADNFSVVDAAFLICDLYPPPADHIYPSEWTTTHTGEEIARAQSLVSALMDWICEGKDVKRQWNMDDASSLAISREDIATWCAWAGLAPQFLLNQHTAHPDQDKPMAGKTRSTHIKIIGALTVAITGKGIDEPRAVANRVLEILGKKGIDQPATVEALAKLLKEYRENYQ